MSEANWPIRVGGIYDPPSPHSYTCRVTAIDGEIVYSILHTRNFDGTISEHHPQKDTAQMFRELYLPEDQSPIPALVEALRAILEHRDDLVADDEGVGEDFRYFLLKQDSLWTAAREALGKAKSTAVADLREKVEA